MSLRFEMFPGCCGFYVVHGFPGSATAGSGLYSKITEEQIKDYIGNHRRIYGKSAGDIVTLDQNQRLQLHDTLVGLGYRVIVDAAYSEKHYSLLTMYFREYHPMSMEEKIDATKDLGGDTTRQNPDNRSFFKVNGGAREKFFGAA